MIPLIIENDPAYVPSKGWGRGLGWAGVIRKGLRGGSTSSSIMPREYGYMKHSKFPI